MTLKQTKKNSIDNTSKKLSVQFSLNGLSFLLLDGGDDPTFEQVVLDHNCTPEELLLLFKETLSKKELLLSEVDEVEVHYASTLYTIVPQPLFDKNKSSDYLKFNSKILATDYIANDTLKSLDLMVVYIPFVNINNFFFEAVGSFSYYHHISKLLTQSALKFLPKDATIVNLRSQEFDLIIYKDNTLQICNSYSFNTSEDFIYYILFTFEQLKINPAEISLQVIGHQFKNSDLHHISEKYIKEVLILDGNFNEMNLSNNQDPIRQFLANK